MTLLEAKLAGLLLDLTDQYGSAFPRPAGLVINFQVVAESTTYQKAKANIEAMLTLHGIIPSKLSITPGPEIKGNFNRSIKVSVARDILL